MISLISFMFALSTLLWIARLEDDIAIMVGLLNGQVNLHARSGPRLMANALVLLNVS
jgi:hypothetical protein